MQIGESKTFNYTGYVQKIVLDDFHELNVDNVLAPTYKLECYGAQASDGTRGDYTCAYLSINQATELLLYVGGQGHNGTNTYGWNSNGSGYYYTCIEYSAGGSQSNISSYTYNYHCSGGATDISFGGTENSTNWNNTDHLNQIVIRAKGGDAANTASRNAYYSYQWNSYGNGYNFSGTHTTSGSGMDNIMRFYMADVYDNMAWSTSGYTTTEWKNLASSTKSAIERAISNKSKYNGHYWKYRTSSQNSVYYDKGSRAPDIDYYWALRTNSKCAYVGTNNHPSNNWFKLTGSGDTQTASCTSADHVSTNTRETMSIGYYDDRTNSDINNGRYSTLYATVYWSVSSSYLLRAEIYENTFQYYNTTQYIGGKCTYIDYFDNSILTKQQTQSKVRSGDGMIVITRVSSTDMYRNSDIRFDSKLVNIMDYTDILNSFIQ